MSDDNHRPPACEADWAVLLQEVSSALHSDASKNVFAIGGSIDLSASPSSSTGTANQAPVTIRWDSGDDRGRKVSLPVVDNDPKSLSDFHRLLGDCKPATFGRGNEDVMDETYRKAGKMDATEFCTNFNYADHGILDTVVQALVPNVSGNENNGLRAELYKLNVSSSQRL
jgi:hypothetical protein